MAILLRILISLASFAVGVIVMTHSFQLVKIVGHTYYAERYLGEGGSYTMWKLIGVALIIGGIWYLFH